ncbi:uncharacterized protein RCO7_04927 [Rhynchosporium graminicola]|uniref:Uncharacterized protein n=1 Tax=Rhynchosporium graminicola TaxID=2792576 RepID=A0A1E1KEE4_9HELO|nr:uncharacterized protein RCO7_04927 [Rhynchosporium commune]
MLSPDKNTGNNQQDDPDAWYNPIRNGRPLLAIRRPLHPPKATEQRVVDNILLALKDFNFQKITDTSIKDLVGQLMPERLAVSSDILIPIGCCGIIDYDIRLQRLRPGSLNIEDTDESSTDASPYSPVVNLRFTNTNGVKGTGASVRRAVLLGRIVAPHQHKERLVQSRWIVVLDQTRLLWVLYANGIDEKDVATSKNGGRVPYSVAWDTAFGARKQFGQKVVLLGSLNNILFKVHKELPDPEVYATDWSTTSVPIDRSLLSKSKLLVSPTTVKRLFDIDTSFFNFPQYRNKNMAWLKNFLRYDQFCIDLDEANKAEHLVIGRTLTEAAWCKVVIQGYKAMDEILEQRDGATFQTDLECLSECLAQRRSPSMSKYWLDKSTKHPGLDLINTPDEHTMGDHFTGLAEWALAMLRDNKSPGNESLAHRRAVSSKVEDMVTPKSEPNTMSPVNGEEISSNTPAGDIIFLRTKAKAQGLIRIIKESHGSNVA